MRMPFRGLRQRQTQKAPLNELGSCFDSRQAMKSHRRRLLLLLSTVNLAVSLLWSGMNPRSLNPISLFRHSEPDQSRPEQTRNITARIEAHKAGTGSEWTRLLKVSLIGDKPVEIRPMTSPLDEDRLVEEYMVIFGIENVRGGSYGQVRLPPATIEFLEKKVATAKDLCVACMRPGHFVKSCPEVWKHTGKFRVPHQLDIYDHKSGVKLIGEVFPCTIEVDREGMPQVTILKDRCNAEGKYIKEYWSEPKRGVVTYEEQGKGRRKFSTATLAIRFMPKFLFHGHIEWFDAMREAGGLVAVTNDTRFFIVHWCSPRFKDLLDLLLRNEAYQKSVEEGRRPVVALTNLVWSSFSKARGLTSNSSSADPSFNSHVVWVGDYEDVMNEKQDVSFSLTEPQAASKRPAAAHAP